MLREYSLREIAQKRIVRKAKIRFVNSRPRTTVLVIINAFRIFIVSLSR